ncbi:phosphorylase [Paraburkholderia sp. BL10I2N1]|uniref:ATP adenylyltransferase family protein n=1 Tax=Paraburkholderia sp. BL10I2N1 TaxID=1938796 RepID=UPI00105CCA27|nr:phosphorylase [Paraburkholderia sp. BL10I2N1]TDN63331.1 ATP adenylyltransferase [Paraburkholderia sp. BL10I2N1]
MNLPLQPGTLWPAILRQTTHALACGALHPIGTLPTTIEDGGVRFLVRQVSSLARKDEDQQKRKARTADGCKPNPFLPYDPDLFVADISETHLALLNKFNVIDHHLLIVTRRFELQEALLNLEDFAALFTCMAQFDGLGFYNGGLAAGASQRHKHLQIVPLPLDELDPLLPIEPLLAAACMDGLIGSVPGLAFPHAFARLEPLSATHPLETAHRAFERYLALLDRAGMPAMVVDGEPRQSAPYNLLVTTQWMLLVPRSTECVEGIPVNALGFAGSLFVRDEMQMETVRRLGPMTVLQRAARSTSK